MLLVRGRGDGNNYACLQGLHATLDHRPHPAWFACFPLRSHPSSLRGGAPGLTEHGTLWALEEMLELRGLVSSSAGKGGHIGLAR